MLILDTKGIVQYCSSPAWFSGIDGGVEGKSITTLVSRLPLRSNTPGYNVAYTRFAWGDRWQRQMINVGESAAVAMDMFLKAVPIGHGYCLVVALKAPVETESGYISMHRSAKPAASSDVCIVSSPALSKLSDFPAAEVISA